MTMSKRPDDSNVANGEAFRLAATAAHEGGGETLQDSGEAIRLFKLAVACGSHEAEYGLGCLYAEDKEFGDDRLAVKYLLMAAESGHDSGFSRLARFFAER